VAAAADAGASSKARRKRKREAAASGAAAGGGSSAAAWANAKVQKRAFSEGWMTFLQMALPDDIYKKVGRPCCGVRLCGAVLRSAEGRGGCMQSCLCSHGCCNWCRLTGVVRRAATTTLLPLPVNVFKTV
jgi:hypothetical protein